MLYRNDVNIIIILSSTYGSPIIVFPVLDIFAKFRPGPPLRGRWIQLGYIKYAISINQECHKRFLRREKLYPPSWNLCFRQRRPPPVSHMFLPCKNSPLKFTVVTLCALLTRDLLAIAKFWLSHCFGADETCVNVIFPVSAVVKLVLSGKRRRVGRRF